MLFGPVFLPIASTSMPGTAGEAVVGAARQLLRACLIQQPPPGGSLAAAWRGYARLPAARPTLYQQLPPHIQQQQQQQPQQQQQQQLQQQQPQQQQPGAARGAPVHKIYRGRWIIPVRYLVRAKVFQLMGGGSVGLAIASLTMHDATWLDVAGLTGLAGGMVAASCCLWYYSRRYVGEMSLLLPHKQVVRFSVLDFWGNREDNDVPLAAITPPFKGVRPAEVSRVTSQLLFPVNVPGDRQYYLSVNAGDILDKQAFLQILKGEFDPQATSSGADDSSSSSSSQPSQPSQQQQPAEQQS